ncbi:N-6 DNA methylase [Streptacidiphilus jiangxiensis]|uniref:N-6 DNA Methylase n=1 Tax=Streptacidiphilus jiangxiensis TaxID=235985 RepID=A0A1H7FF88_STRJI|nr:N-6 DNA methylase [Streptacidiphilus jiangxiensis]SEK24741.1 N-6 DNA Methylase [Streptacidiphilus jiangxiensis]
MTEQSNQITAAEIARLAGVGRAAVSNWRRRHADFPKPVGGTETSPAFALADVERWLRGQGKLSEVPLRERVWQQVAAQPEGVVPTLVRIGGVLLLVRDHPDLGAGLTDQPDAELAELLPGLLDHALDYRLGQDRPVHTPSGSELLPLLPLLRAVVELAADLGARQTYEFLLGRYLDANPRLFTLTPPGLAELMTDLAGISAGIGTQPGRELTVLDPAVGTGGLLRAATFPPSRPAALHAVDIDPGQVALAALRLALESDAEVRAAAADGLRADPFPGLRADAVLCHPPFNERDWGYDELSYDARWEYGLPPRVESELAWVQYALARLREGGTAVLLLPPAVASRRSGRRIRAELLRRGALRAVVALPAGAAPPQSVPLHLWVLRRPGADALGAGAAGPELLLVDASALPAVGAGDRVDWPLLRTAVLHAWDRFEHGRPAQAPAREGVVRAVPVLELLDDDVDLTPARHLPSGAAGASGLAELGDIHRRLSETLRRTTELTPVAPPAEPLGPAGGPRWTSTTVGELARTGALVLRSGGVGAVGEQVRVLTDQDVLAGTGPTGAAGLLSGDLDEEPVLLREGDVVVPVLGGGSVARVVGTDTAGAALGRNLQVLRPEPAALDPWFLAGFLRGSANARQASSYASTAARLDVRRLQLPRLPLSEQHRYGASFRDLAAFEEALLRAGRLGDRLVRGLHDALTDGALPPATGVD